MPRSSRHKSHKQSKHSPKEHSDSEDGLRKMKERSSKDENSSRAYGETASGEKRKTSSHVREGREKEANVNVNGKVLEEYVSSKRRKGKVNAFVDGDRWNGGGDGKDTSDRAFEKELDKGNSMKVDEKHRDKSNKGESLKLEHKNKSKRNEHGHPGDRIEVSSAQIVVDKEEKNRSLSKRKSDKDSSSYKDGRDSKDNDHRVDKERNCDYGSSRDADVKVVDWDSGKKKSGNVGDERHSKRPRDNTDDNLKNVLESPEPEKEYEKRFPRKREYSREREKHSDDYKEGDERRGPTKTDSLKDEKPRDVKYKDKVHAERSLEDNHRSGRKKDEKYLDESEKDHMYYDEKHREYDEKYAKHQDYRYHEDADRDIKRKDEKRNGDVENGSKRKDDKSRQVHEDRRDDKYHEDAYRNNRRKDERYHEDGDKNVRSVDNQYIEDDDPDDKHRSDGGERECRNKDKKYRDDAEKDLRQNANPGDGVDREKRQRESKYDRDFRDRSGDRSDKRSGDDGYPPDGHARKSSTHDESPNHDYRTPRNKDDQNRRRANEKEDCGEGKSRSTKDPRSDPCKRNPKMDSASDRMRTTSRNADAGHPSHSKRRGSPSSSSHGLRDNYRSSKQDESKYRDYNDERPRDNLASTRQHVGSLEGFEKTASRSLEKLVSNDHSQLSEQSSERHLMSDIHLSPLQRTGGSQHRKGARGSRELGLDAGPTEKRVQADDDALSISSPSMKNNRLSGNLRSSLPPPPFRSVDSPSPMGSAEDDGRNRYHSHHRRIGDPSMGRIQGNVWRGVPTWPSPMPNGFLPFPHAPSPVGFHPAMQPFPAPPMFGVRPSMELNLHSSYQMSDHDRYFGPGHPMGWQNPVDDTCPPLQSWDANVAAYGDDSRVYGRSDWDQRNMAVGHGWESTDDAQKGASRDKSLEIQSVGKENNSLHVGDGYSQSLQPYQSDQTLVDQQEDSTDIRLSTKIMGMSNAGVHPNSANGSTGFTNKEKTETFGLCKAYLCKLEISADLVDPELFSKFTNLISSNHAIISDLDDSKIVYVEDVEAKMSNISSPSSSLLPIIDDSVFLKSISLYKKLKQQTLNPTDAAKSEALIESDLKTENLCHGLHDDFLSEPDPNSSSLKAIPVADFTLKTKATDEMQPSSSITINDGCVSAPAPRVIDESMAGNEIKDVKKQRPESTLADEDMDVKSNDAFFTPTHMMDESMAGTEDKDVKDDVNEPPSSPIAAAGTENNEVNVKEASSSPVATVSRLDNHPGSPMDEFVGAHKTVESTENKEVKGVGTDEFGALLNSDIVSDSESNMAEVVDLSRIQ